MPLPPNPHHDAILDAWEAELTVVQISAVLTAAGAQRCTPGTVSGIILRARAEGDPRAVAITASERGIRSHASRRATLAACRGQA